MTYHRKVLLVEDDEFTQFMMKEIIGTLGVGVEIAGNGAEVWDLLQAGPDDFGVVLMDIHMPKVSGLSAVKTIRSSPENPPNSVPIIAVTADVNYHDEAVVEKLGMNGYASKPVTPGKLLELIDRYCVEA